MQSLQKLMLVKGNGEKGSLQREWREQNAV